MRRMSWMKMMLGWILGIAGLFAFRTEARTVSVAAQTESAVTLAFGDADGRAYELFLAHGATDGEDNKYAWTGFAKVADVALDATTLTYEVPAALRDGRQLRFFLMQTAGVAYAKELDCVTSTGKQWVNTGFTPTSRTVVDFRFGNVTYKTGTAFFGQNWGNSRYLFNQQSDVFKFHGGGTTVGPKPAANTDYRCWVVEDSGSSGYLFLSYGSTTNCYTISRSVGSGVMAIFGANTGTYLSSFSLYRMKIVEQNPPTLKRDFIPALDAEGVAGLYDQANDVFYKSETTTPLNAGNELSQDRFGRVLDMTPTFSFRRSVSIASQDENTVTLAFGNSCAASYKLFVGYGPTDGGKDKNAWANFTEVATIAGDATTYTYTIPAALMPSGTFYRFFLMQTDNLPYVSEVASLTSTGEQFVRLGYAPGVDTTVDFRFGNLVYANNKALFGQGWQGYNYLLNIQSDVFKFHGSSVTLDSSVLAATDYRCQITDADQLVLSHGDEANVYNIGRAADPLFPITIFADSGGLRGATYRFDSLLMKDNGLVVYDLVPVVDAAGRGVLFDRENGVCWANLSGTDFTKGATLGRTGWVVAATASSYAAASNAVGRAVWTGNGNRSNVNDPANWTCYSFAGAVLEGAVPTADTEVVVTENTSFNAPIGCGLVCRTVSFPASATLTADCDWSGVSAYLEDGIVVNLNGRDLRLASPTTSSAANPIVVNGTGGTLRITIPGASENCPSDCLVVNASVRLVKDGPGTFLNKRVMPAVTALTVEQGIFKNGLLESLPETAPITVQRGAAFDFGGYGLKANYTIEGDGPDGVGALRNTGANIANNSRQIKGIALSGDATIGGSANFGLIYTSYGATTFELNGHALTIDLAAGKCFWFCNTTGSTAGTVYVRSGTVRFYHKSYEVSLPNVDFVIDGPNSIFHAPPAGSNNQGSYAKKITVNSLTAQNGGTLNEEYNVTYMQNLILLDGALVPNAAVRWFYVAKTVLVSNETSDITLYPPINLNGTGAKLIKKGAGTFTIANNHTDQRMDGGVEIFGGTVVMSSSRTSGAVPHKAISSQQVPVIIHSGGTLDMRQCGTSAFLLKSLVIEDGGTLLHTAENKISFQSATTFTKPEPFAFTGAVTFTQPATFDLNAYFSQSGAPTAGTPVTLLQAGTITTSGSSTRFTVTGCPYDADIDVTDTTVTLTSVAADATLPDPIKIWTVGGNFVYGHGTTGDNFRFPLTRLLAAEGWNVKMTGWRTASANGVYASSAAWGHHCGIVDLALKTSATRAGLLEGLETYAAAASEPDFTIFVCGDKDVADGVADATVLANYQAAVTRIKAALPMTTVLAATIPGDALDANATLNADIAAWCATQTDVECVDLASVMTTAITESECEAAAALLKAKLMTLATENGKNTPSTWTRPTVTLGAENNVPAEYRTGYTRVRSIEPDPMYAFAQNLYTIPYVYAPPMKETGITKVAYYIELVRKDTGALQALWVDMDAPGPNWADVAFPVTVAQQKQQVVTNLHVWSNFGGVSIVPANDDSVKGYIEFNPINYSAGDTTKEGAITEPWSGGFGFNDTFYASGTSGHGCFQLMRKFDDPTAFPAAEILFAYDRWGAGTDGYVASFGMGTLANYGTLGASAGTKTLDWTYIADSAGTDLEHIGGLAYSYIRIDFWVQYEGGAPSRADLADAVWTGATDDAFATPGNWGKDETAATSLANSKLLIPDTATPTFTYVGYDPVNLSTATLMADGTATFPEVGGFYLAALDVGATGKLVYDPTKFTFRLIAPPTFASGAKIALTPNYAANTGGRFLLMTWDNGALEMADADLNAIFDTGSANGTDVKVWAENLDSGGGRLWLDLNYSAPKTRLNVVCVGDSITQGNDSTYGNWRTGLMKKLAAAGYEPVAKGHHAIQSHDICGATMPDEWVRHCGIGSQAIITSSSRAGTLDAIENFLDQAGDVDFVLLKLGTNDINGNKTKAIPLFPAWKELAWKILNQKPHAKLIAGAVVDIAYNATLDAEVVAFNTMIQNAIAGGEFPAKRAYFADLYTPCYRYDANHNYIVGSFNSESNLHPDWPGEDKMAATYRDAIETALADAESGWTPGDADLTVPTTSGSENNVPAEYRAGFTRACVLDVATFNRNNLATLAYVPYSQVNAAAPTTNLSRVGYYIELKRKNDALSDFHGLTRWMWVSMDAFGNRTLADVGVPLTTVNQRVVRRLRVKTNMPGIESTVADASGVKGWIEFWPSSYSNASSGLEDAPGRTYGHDWNSLRNDNMSGFGSMQVHRFTPGARNPAQVMFSFNHWSVSGAWEIGLGNFAHQKTSSIDWTFTSSSDRYMVDTMTADAYEVAKIEIWTASMTDDPDAPVSALVYIGEVAGEHDSATVTGTLIDFGGDATSATVSLEWSTDPAFATVAGSASVGEVSELGTITATATGLTVGETWYFRFTSENSNGATATSDASDPLPLVAGYWRPQTVADTWTSIAWLQNNAGSPVAFNPIWTAVFDGQETTRTATVQIPEEVAAEAVFVEGTQNYTFDGVGSIAARRLVKEGSGTVTLDNRALANTPDIEIRGGTVKLGDNAVVGAAGSDGGTITVKNGGQFDFNYNYPSGASGTTRAKVTSNKKFLIEGDGPDHQGALVSSCGSNVYNSALGQIELTGDATIGGPGRLELREGNTLTGPSNATLTVAVKPSNDYGFGVNTGISVGKVVVAENSKMKFEGTTLSIDIPYGIDLYGQLRFYGCDGTWNGGVTACGTGATIGNNNGTAYIKTPVTVAEGATLTMNGSATTRYESAFTNRSTVVVSSGSHYLLGNQVNEDNPVIRSAVTFYDRPKSVTGDSRAEVTANQFRISGSSNWGDSALHVTLSTGGSLVLGENGDGYGYPKFRKNKLSVTATSGHTGTFFLYSSISDTFDGLTIDGPLNNFYAQGPNNKAVIDSTVYNFVFSAKQFTTGTTSGRGEHTFAGPETDISATTVQMGNGASKNYYGMLNFKEGLLTVGSGGITTAWRQPARPMFLMSGGTLRAGADFAVTQPGMTIDFGDPLSDGDVTLDLNNKTVKWGTALTGGSDVTITGSGTFTTDRPGIQGIPTGKWTIETTGSNVDLRNAAGFAGGLSLAENATATLDIAGTNLLEMVAWTWYSSPNAWNTMRPLYLADQVIAPHVVSSFTFFNRTASKIRDIKRDNTSGTGYNILGQFYVSEAQAGSWSFTHRCKTHFGLIIDGTELSKSGLDVNTTVSANLTEGWHDFMLSAYSNATDPNIGPYSGSESIRFKAPGDADYKVFDTTTVPMRMRQEASARTSVRWRMYKAGADSVNVFATADEGKYTSIDIITNSLQLLHGFYADAGTNAPLAGAAARFTGLFHVSAENAGLWTFSANFDDRIALTVDGTRLITSTSVAENTAQVALREGWHRFDIRTGDGSADNAASSGAKLTDVDGNVCAVRFKVNGGDYHSFDERYVPIAVSAHDTQKFEQAGLGGVTELAAGSTLTNEPLEGGFCPIYGTVKGAGTLSGPYRFVGEDNCWEISGSQSAGKPANTITFANADDQTFAGLKRIKVTFDGKPQRSYYTLVETAPGLTAEGVEAITLEVADTAENDYTEDFTLLLDSGRLLLKNAHPIGFMFFIR